MKDLHLEFLVEPFVPGDPGPHVVAAVAAVESAGVAVEVGPFATTATASTDDISTAVAALLRDAFAAGATRMSIVADTVMAGAAPPPTGTVEPVAVGDDTSDFLAAVRPIVSALGATVVAAADQPGDIPLAWRGVVVAAVRPAPLTGALDHLIAQVEGELGGRLTSLDRAAKQQAVALLHERGAFALRRSTDAVAEAMGVSRITIYNYLNALETESDQS